MPLAAQTPHARDRFVAGVVGPEVNALQFPVSVPPICSVAVDLRISNVVDVPNYVVSALLPETIFDGD